MVKIDLKELIKAVDILHTQSLGGNVIIKEDGAMLKMISVDRNNKEMEIELSDTSYPFKPRIRKTDTF